MTPTPIPAIDPCRGVGTSTPSVFRAYGLRGEVGESPVLTDGLEDRFWSLEASTVRISSSIDSDKVVDPLLAIRKGLGSISRGGAESEGAESWLIT